MVVVLLTGGVGNGEVMVVFLMGGLGKSEVVVVFLMGGGKFGFILATSRVAFTFLFNCSKYFLSFLSLMLSSFVFLSCSIKNNFLSFTFFSFWARSSSLFSRE